MVYSTSTFPRHESDRNPAVPIGHGAVAAHPWRRGQVGGPIPHDSPTATPPGRNGGLSRGLHLRCLSEFEDKLLGIGKAGIGGAGKRTLKDRIQTGMGC